MKRLIIGLVIFIVIGAVIIKSLFNAEITFNPMSAGAEEITVSDSKITMKLTNQTSAQVIVAYTVEYKNEILYIKLKSPDLITVRKSIDSISMDNKYGNIKEIYLQGDNPSENKLIYPKK